MNLYNTQYSEQKIIDNINQLDLNMILCNQKLSAYFCANYILNKKYQCSSEEKDIDIHTVLQKQRHITYNEIINELHNK
jgi:hypothetical protein